MTLSWTQLTSIFAQNCFSRWGTLLEGIAKAIAIQESQFAHRNAVNGKSFRWVHDYLNLLDRLIQPEYHQLTGRYAD